MRKFFKNFLSKFCFFVLAFYLSQYNREIIVKSILTKTIGPIHVEKNLYIDKDMSLEETFIIVSAAHQWEKQTKGIIKIKIIPMVSSSDYLVLHDSKAVAITKMSTEDSFMKEVEKQVKVLGLFVTRFQIDTIIINVDRIEDDFQYRGVVMHELGHAFGLPDTTSEFTLMYKSDDLGTYSITNEDLKNFCDIYLCDYKK